MNQFLLIWAIQRYKNCTNTGLSQIYQQDLHYELQGYFSRRGSDKAIDLTCIYKKIQGNAHTSCHVPEKLKT